MLQRSGQSPKIPRRKYKSVIITELKNIWSEIIKNQRLDQDRKKK